MNSQNKIQDQHDLDNNDQYIELIKNAAKIIKYNKIENDTQFQHYDCMNSIINCPNSFFETKISKSSILNSKCSEIIVHYLLEELFESFTQGKNCVTIINFFQQEILAIEISYNEAQNYIKSQNKQDYILNLLYQQLIIAKPSFLSSKSQHLINKYQYEQLLSKQEMTILIYIEQQNLQILNDKYHIENGQLIEQKQNSDEKIYIPFEELQKAHSDKRLLQLIIDFSNNESLIKNNSNDMKEIINYSQNILQWQNLIIKLLSDNDKLKFDYNQLFIEKIEKYEKIYNWQSIDGLSIKFFNCSIQEQMEQYLEQCYCDMRCYKKSYAYQIFQQGIILYSRYYFQSYKEEHYFFRNNLFIQINLLFDIDKQFQQYGNIGQIVLVDVETNKQKCNIINFEMRKEYLDILHLQLKKDEFKSQLSKQIISALCNIAAHKVNSIVLYSEKRQTFFLPYYTTITFPNQ